MRKVLTTGVVTVTWRYFAREIRPILGAVVLCQQTLIAVICGMGVALCGHNLTGAPKTIDIAVGFLAYASLALGTCLAGITIALTLPDRPFLQELAKLEVRGHGNALSRLLLVFTWTGLVHWICIVSILSILVFDGGNGNRMTANLDPVRKLLLFWMTACCVYALEMFLITLLTIADVGSLFADRLKREP